jgi:hypothetical protein
MPNNSYIVQKPVRLLDSYVYTPCEFMCDGLRDWVRLSKGKHRIEI